MILVDTHCHLNHPPLCLDTDGVLARAAAALVTRVVAPAYDTTSWDDLTALANRPGVDIAYGLHPWLAHDLPGQVAALEGERPAAPAELQPATGPPKPVPPAAQAAALERLIAHLAARIEARRPVAIGEIGLDTKITASGLAVQMPLLERQLALAVDLDLPVILHCRGAFEELLAAAGRHGGRLRGVLHAFSRGPDLAARFTAAGLYLALGGAVTQERAQQVRRAARIASLDRLVLETDAPSIGLQDVPPDRTEPRHVREIAVAVAALRGESVAAVAAATTAAADRLFAR